MDEREYSLEVLEESVSRAEKAAFESLMVVETRDLSIDETDLTVAFVVGDTLVVSIAEFAGQYFPLNLFFVVLEALNQTY